MKTADEILKMLIGELFVHLDSDFSVKKEGIFYNRALGDSSFLLAGLLQLLLRENVPQWDSKSRWLDDSLITHVRLNENKLVLGGVMIWGKRDTTEQWVDLFSFETEPLSKEARSPRFTFSFCDAQGSERKYEDYRGDSLIVSNYEDVSWKYVLESEKLRSKR